MQSTMVEAEAGVLELRVSDRAARVRPGSDNALLAEGFATMTALAAPHAMPVDLGSLVAELKSA